MIYNRDERNNIRKRLPDTKMVVVSRIKEVYGETFTVK